MSSSINKLKSHMLITCKNFMFSDLTWETIFCSKKRGRGGGGGGASGPPSPLSLQPWQCNGFGIYVDLSICRMKEKENWKLSFKIQFLSKIIIHGLYSFSKFMKTCKTQRDCFSLHHICFEDFIQNSRSDLSVWRNCRVDKLEIFRDMHFFYLWCQITGVTSTII